ncbi:transient receptor potential cation channel subfamily M member-like 2 [Glandiceps talaboti]
MYDEERQRKQKKYKRKRSRRHLSPKSSSQVGDSSTTYSGSTQRSHVEGNDNHGRDRSSSPNIRQRSVSQPPDVQQTQQHFDHRTSDKTKQPVQEEIITAKTEDDVKTANLDILKRTSEQNWHKEVADFVKSKKIKQRYGVGDKELEDCDSFGEINFIGFGHSSKSAPYIRVDKNTKADILWDLLIDHWEMPTPKVLISVTGGAQDFFFKDRLKNLFNKGLYKAAVSTGGWIVTGGTGVGVMKKVGEAIKEESKGTTNDSHRKVVALGIATWGIISNNAILQKSPKREGWWPAEYIEKDLKLAGKLTSLDSNHTHFILVDHGKVDFGADIGLRANLEQFINTAQTQNGKSKPPIPVVLVVVQGGYGTIETVYKSLIPPKDNASNEYPVQSIPVVIVEGSGKAADAIAEALRKTKVDSNSDTGLVRDTLKNMDIIREVVDPERKLEKRFEECVGWFQEMMMPPYRDMITVFRMQEDNFKDIDRAILHGLLQAQSLSDDIRTQLNLALRWNRCDIARDEIITAERRVKWQGAQLEENMMTALRANRSDFVELFLQHVIYLDKFLTVERLNNLYYSVIFSKHSIDGRTGTTDILISRLENFSLKGVQKGKENTHLLQRVGRVIQELTFHEYDRLYREDKYVVKTQNQGQCNTKEVDFECPDQHLFLWAVLLNRREMAKVFWKRLNIGNIGAALIAGRILKALSLHAEIEEELTLYFDLVKHADEFEDLAIGVMENCYEDNKKMSKLALVRKLPEWGGTTCFSIAYSAEQMKFIEHDCCQTKLQRVWKGNVQIHSYKQWAKYVFAFIFPFIIPSMTFLANDYQAEFDPEEESNASKDEKQEETKEDKQKLELTRWEKVKNVLRWTSSYQPGKGSDVRHIGGEPDDVTLWEGLSYYYKAPVSKFYFSTILYIALLFLFSWFILTDLRPASENNSPSVVEWIVIAWVATLMVEEIRQIHVKEPKSAFYRIWSWASDAWNIFDFLMFVFFIISVILRFTLSSDNFYIARIIYCITMMLFYFRLLHMGFVQKDIGPKIIMIFKMLKDLMYFLVILVIFILSFGIANEAILYPNMEPNLLVIFKSIYKPYWQLYGELFLEEIEGLENDTCYEDPRYMGRCPETEQYSWVAPVLTAIYMLISNILLINLLIAMFSFTFQKVQEKSETIWRYYRYELISEYFDRPALAPPLIIINHLYRFCKMCWYKIDLNRKLTKAEQSLPATDREKKKEDIMNAHNTMISHCLKVQVDDRLEDYLNGFEKKHMENYFIKMNQEYAKSWESTVSSSGERIDKISNDMEEMREFIGISGKQEPTQGRPGTAYQRQTSHTRTATSGNGTRGDMDTQVQQLTTKVTRMENKMDRILEMMEKSLSL